MSFFWGGICWRTGGTLQPIPGKEMNRETDEGHRRVGGVGKGDRDDVG